MAKPLVTEDSVFKMADQIHDEGQEPTILLVQERIGGGSYSTVKKYLDQWKEQRKSQQHVVIELPSSLATKMTTSLQTLWTEAVTLADQRVAEIQAEAQQQVREAQHTLGEAERIIARQETTIEEQAQRLAGADERIAALQEEGERIRAAHQAAEVRLEAQTQQLGDLQQRNEHLQADLEQARTARHVAESRLGDMTQRVATTEQQLEDLRTHLEHAQSAIHVAQTRASEYEQQVQDLKADVVTRTQQYEAAIAEQARLTGHVESMTQQLHEQAAMIERLMPQRDDRAESDA